jgi:hypothetical protein
MLIIDTDIPTRIFQTNQDHSPSKCVYALPSAWLLLILRIMKGEHRPEEFESVVMSLKDELLHLSTWRCVIDQLLCRSCLGALSPDANLFFTKDSNPVSLS